MYIKQTLLYVTVVMVASIVVIYKIIKNKNND